MGRFLQNLIRTGGRPLARKGATRRGVLLPELSVERVAPDPRELEAPAMAQPEPPAVAQPASREIDAGVATLAPPPLPRTDPDAGARIVPQRPDPPAPPPRVVERVTEIVPAPATERPSPPVGRGAPTVPPRAPDEPRDVTEETSRRDDDHVADERPRAAAPRLPVPTRVETLRPTVQPDFARRVTPPRESSAPEGRTPSPRRVEFHTITETRVVRAKPVVQAVAPPASHAAPEPPRLRLEPSPPATAERAPAQVSAPPAAQPQAAEPAVRERQPPREQRSQPAAPAIASTAPVAASRRDAESTVTIRQLDIQIVGEEPRRSPVAQQANPARDGIDNLHRLYVREGV